MKFSMKKSALISASSKIVNIIPKKNIKPILSGVKIHGNETDIFFSATDMESSMMIKIDQFEKEGNGAFVIDALTLEEISKNLLKDEVFFTLEPNKAIAYTGAGEIKIPVMNADDYPDLDFEDVGEPIQLQKDIILKMISKVLFCASTDEMMRNLNGVLWEFSGKYLRLVSADSYRMAVTEEIVFDEERSDLNFFLSLKSMKEIQTLLKESDEELFAIRFDGKKVITKIRNTFFTARLMDVSFPNYKAVLPEQFQTKIIIDRVEILKALRLINIIAKGKGDTVKLNIEENKLQISARSQDRGDGDIPFEITQEGKDMLIAFDPVYLIEGLEHFDSDQLEMNFVDENNALQINDTQLSGFLHIIMPVKIRS